MKIMAWKIKGVGRLDFLPEVKKLSRMFDPSILFLSKTKVNASRSIDILLKINLIALTLLI